MESVLHIVDVGACTLRAHLSAAARDLFTRIAQAPQPPSPPPCLPPPRLPSPPSRLPPPPCLPPPSRRRLSPSISPPRFRITYRPAPPLPAPAPLRTLLAPACACTARRSGARPPSLPNLRSRPLVANACRWRRPAHAAGGGPELPGVAGQAGHHQHQQGAPLLQCRPLLRAPGRRRPRTLPSPPPSPPVNHPLRSRFAAVHGTGPLPAGVMRRRAQ